MSSYPQIGSWSRWLTDLFGIDDSDAPDDDTELSDQKRLNCETSFKAFRLLNALSDLMMLPFDMLADKSTRKEVSTGFVYTPTPTPTPKVKIKK